MAANTNTGKCEEAYRARTALATANREQKKGQTSSKHHNQTRNHVDNTGKYLLADQISKSYEP